MQGLFCKVFFYFELTMQNDVAFEEVLHPLKWVYLFSGLHGSVARGLKHHAYCPAPIEMGFSYLGGLGLRCTWDKTPCLQSCPFIKWGLSYTKVGSFVIEWFILETSLVWISWLPRISSFGLDVSSLYNHVCSVSPRFRYAPPWAELCLSRVLFTISIGHTPDGFESFCYEGFTQDAGLWDRDRCRFFTAFVAVGGHGDLVPLVDSDQFIDEGAALGAFLAVERVFDHLLSVVLNDEVIHIVVGDIGHLVVEGDRQKTGFVIPGSAHPARGMGEGEAVCCCQK